MTNVRKKHVKTKLIGCLLGAVIISGLFFDFTRDLYLAASLGVYRLLGGNWFFCEAIQGKIEFVDLQFGEDPPKQQRSVKLSKTQQQAIAKLLNGAVEEEMETPEARNGCYIFYYYITPEPLGWQGSLTFDYYGRLNGYILPEKNDIKLSAEIMSIVQSFTNAENSGVSLEEKSKGQATKKRD